MEGGGEEGGLEGREGGLKGRLDQSQSLVLEREVGVGPERGGGREAIICSVVAYVMYMYIHRVSV